MTGGNASAGTRPGWWLAAVLFAVGVLAGCRELPPLDGRTVSTALVETGDTRLGRGAEPLTRAHPGLVGILPLSDAREAFAARALLADAADRSLDIQYYIWHGDMSGTLLFEAVHRAADRGVRVRLLLDDNNTGGLDARLAALDSHANIEVRLFNPFMHRRARWLGYLTDFSRLNRRMHNKSFTADNQATIIGGRNIGDEYFDAGEHVMFVDLDVMAVGPVVDEVSADFDRYWSSGSSYPLASVLDPVPPAAIDELTRDAVQVEAQPAAREYTRAIAGLPFVRQLLDGELAVEWVPARMISDDPAKGLGLASDEQMLPWKIQDVIGLPREELHLVSPYFVPGDDGVAALAAMAHRGVAVSVLTNALEATDVVAVHAGYAKRRQPLLEAGVALFETRRLAASPVVHDRGLPGSSGSSLHAKTFAVDRSRAFIGSFNFDPRSARLNTEMGFVIDSPRLAGGIANAFAARVPEEAYEVRLGEDGQLQWVARDGGVRTVLDQEPGAGFMARLSVAVLERLPIEWLL